MPLYSRSCTCPQCTAENPLGCAACWKCGYPMAAYSENASRRPLSVEELESLLSQAQLLRLAPETGKTRRPLDWLSSLWHIKGRKA